MRFHAAVFVIKSGLNHLHLNESSAFVGGKQELLPVDKLDTPADRDIFSLGKILKRFQSLIDEGPSALVNDEIADWFLLLGSESLAREDSPVGVPEVEILITINHQAMIVGSKLTLSSRRIEIQDREITLEGGVAKGANRLCLVLKDIPLLLT